MNAQQNLEILNAAKAPFGEKYRLAGAMPDCPDTGGEHDWQDSRDPKIYQNTMGLQHCRQCGVWRATTNKKHHAIVRSYGQTVRVKPTH